MTKKEVCDQLYHHLSRLFAPLGFKSQRKAQRFVRTVGDVVQSIWIPFYTFNPTFRFSLLFGFRVEAVEALYHLFSGVEPTHQATSNTCSVRVEHLAPDVPPQGIAVSPDRSVGDA